MKQKMVLVLSLGTILLTACNQEVKEKEVLVLQLEKEVKEKEALVLQLEKENLELKNNILEFEQEKIESAKETNRFKYIKDTSKIDLNSILIYENPKSINYDLHQKTDKGVDIIINSTILCNEQEYYIVSIQAPESLNMSTHNVGYSKKIPLPRQNSAVGFIYANYCLS